MGAECRLELQLVLKDVATLLQIHLPILGPFDSYSAVEENCCILIGSNLYAYLTKRLGDIHGKITML